MNYWTFSFHAGFSVFCILFLLPRYFPLRLSFPGVSFAHEILITLATSRHARCMCVCVCVCVCVCMCVMCAFVCKCARLYASDRVRARAWRLLISDVRETASQLLQLHGDRANKKQGRERDRQENPIWHRKIATCIARRVFWPTSTSLSALSAINHASLYSITVRE